jgi:hypothetical protein
MALLTLTAVELIPPHRPLSEDTVTITFFFTSTPSKQNNSKAKKKNKIIEDKNKRGQKCIQ